MARISICATPGCPEYAERRYCEDHARSKEQARGSRQERGYDAKHDALRARWQPAVEAGKVSCARCHEPIRVGQPWALDHNDARTGYLGPSHARCNSVAGGQAAHGC